VPQFPASAGWEPIPTWYEKELKEKLRLLAYEAAEKGILLSDPE